MFVEDKTLVIHVIPDITYIYREGGRCWVTPGSFVPDAYFVLPRGRGKQRRLKHDQ